MTCYSVDLRRKVVEAYFQGGNSIRKVAKLFSMSKDTVQSYIKKYRETQDLTPLKPGTKKVSKLEEHRDFILNMVQQHPDWTLNQYCDYLAEHRNVDASGSIMSRFLQKEEITLKKRPIAVRLLRQKKVKISG